MIPSTVPSSRVACSICRSTEETVFCDWKVPTEIILPIEEASIGDVWIYQNKERGRIAEIERVPHSELLLVTVVVQGHPWPYAKYRSPDATFTTERLLSCGNPVCFRHHREVGDNRHYCRDHWEL
jgi:hypothetical protein